LLEGIGVADSRGQETRVSCLPKENTPTQHLRNEWITPRAATVLPAQWPSRQFVRIVAPSMRTGVGPPRIQSPVLNSRNTGVLNNLFFVRRVSKNKPANRADFFIWMEHSSMHTMKRSNSFFSMKANEPLRTIHWPALWIGSLVMAKLTVTTTTEHLAQRLGHAVEKAFGGNADYDFSHENKLARVSWRRD
jgi:hypothetical protein